MQNLDVLAGQREAKLAAPDMIPGLSWSKFSFINEFNACNNDLARFVRIARRGSVWSAKRGGAKTMWPWSTSGWILPVWPDCLRPKGGLVDGNTMIGSNQQRGLGHVALTNRANSRWSAVSKTLVENPVLLLFLVIGVGYLVGQVRYRGFGLGVVRCCSPAHRRWD